MRLSDQVLQPEPKYYIGKKRESPIKLKRLAKNEISTDNNKKDVNNTRNILTTNCQKEDTVSDVLSDIE